MLHETDIKPPRIRYIALLGITVIGVGMVFYHIVEDLTWIDSLYFCVITLTTIGYGDITPTTEAGRLFTTFYVIIGIGIFAAVINFFIKRAAVNRISKHQARLEEKANHNHDQEPKK